jgi:DNA-binding CsgD family transcriptional regulator
MLSAKDYERIFELQFQLYSYNQDFRDTVLKALQELYQGYPMCFFLTDNNNQYINPVSINISSEIMKSYQEYYFKTDIFHTQSLPQNLLDKQILHITDIMPINRFEETEFYHGALKTLGVYDEIALQLHFKNKLLGVIGIMKPKGYGNFTDKEKQYAALVRKTVIPRLNEYLERLKIQHENNMVLAFAKEAPIGMILFDSQFKAIQYNRIAKQYVNEICGSDNEKKVNEILLKILSDKLYFNEMGFNTMQQVFINNYSFKIVPFVIPDLVSKFSTFYTVYILKNEENQTIDYEKLKSCYGLTNRECEMINLLFQGHTNNKIAEELYISSHTVKTHIQNIFKKFNVSSRAELMHLILLKTS